MRQWEPLVEKQAYNTFSKSKSYGTLIYHRRSQDGPQEQSVKREGKSKKDSAVASYEM
jgi:hypothetical protein